ncbi:MAG: TonB-dependent receptor [Neisseria sp.]|uniref:TonB-dependent receptor n=1 Tax=Neisseria sp. TaxID=192066 RepID=UPI0026DBDB8B|nr:TonB-dependent receptor [Neisseria sp.]MDO4641849.1 TonB-dependent receptor [Neisseria sp.]
MNKNTSFFTRSLLAIAVLGAYTQGFAAEETATQNIEPTEVETVTVNASADASKGGLQAAYPGGQVAKGARVGVLGNKTTLETPFSTTAYTSKLVQDKHARTVGDVLQNDPTVRVARGFGNFQEAYFIRGFVTGSDDTMYNGLYGILPRQTIATEPFERVEIQRGASTFLNGMAPGGGALGGTVNLLPKRAPNEPLTRISAGYGAGTRGNLSTDVARRFGAEQQFGVRVNAAHHNGHTAVHDERAKLSLFNVGLDWRGEKARVSADVGWQDNRLKATRTNVALNGTTAVPAAPSGSANWAQPWSYSNERDFYGTLRGEYDFNDNLTAYAAYGMRDGKEKNRLANVTVSNAAGDATFYRWDNARRDQIHTGEIGLRGKFATGAVQHEWGTAANHFHKNTKNAYTYDLSNSFNTNIYTPVYYALPAWSSGANATGNMNHPALTDKTRMTSVALYDTLSAFDKRLLLTLGARWQKVRSASLTRNTEYSQSRWSPSVAAVYRITPQLSVYGNYIEGLSEGSKAPVGTANAGQMLEPFVTKQKEAGLKYEGERFGAGAALFSVDKPRNAGTGSDNVFRTEGKDRHNGLELTAYGEVSKGLRLLGGLTFLDAKQKSTGSADTQGKRTIGVPKTQANIGVEWELPQVQGLAFDTRMVYTGSSYADDTNTLKVGGWTRFDVGARYRMNIKGHEATFRARVDNLTNKKYWASAGGYPGYGYLNAAAPRSVSLSATFDF